MGAHDSRREAILNSLTVEIVKVVGPIIKDQPVADIMSGLTRSLTFFVGQAVPITGLRRDIYRELATLFSKMADFEEKYHGAAV
jgi:hypothetical protein